MLFECRCYWEYGNCFFIDELVFSGLFLSKEIKVNLSVIF